MNQVVFMPASLREAAAPCTRPKTHAGMGLPREREKSREQVESELAEALRTGDIATDLLIASRGLGQAPPSR
jgi:hypothetical protein